MGGFTFRHTSSSQMKTRGKQISRQSCSTEMECPQMFRKGGDGSNRLVLLCLCILNVALLIVAVVIGIKCVKVTDVSPQVETGLNDLHRNHSDVVKAEEEAKEVKEALKSALKQHAQMKAKIEQQKTINANYQRQIEALQTEENSLQSNISALEGTCGRCPIGWIHLNSSCYFFSYNESPHNKKNWRDSRADCRGRGADLIVIDDPEEQKFVCATIEEMGDNQSFWLGLSDMKEEGKWVWINNVTEVEERYWKDGEPNNHGIGEDCAATFYRPTAPWKIRNDLGCTRHSVYWICEM